MKFSRFVRYRWVWHAASWGASCPIWRRASPLVSHQSGKTPEWWVRFHPGGPDMGGCSSRRLAAALEEKCLCLHNDFWLAGFYSCAFQIALSFATAAMDYKTYLALPTFREEAPCARLTLAGQFVLTVVPLTTQLLFLMLQLVEGSACFRTPAMPRADPFPIPSPGVAQQCCGHQGGGGGVLLCSG
jgi:hypothetical protein